MVAVESFAARAHRRSTGQKPMTLSNPVARLLLLGYLSAWARAGIAGTPEATASSRTRPYVGRAAMTPNAGKRQACRRFFMRIYATAVAYFFNRQRYYLLLRLLLLRRHAAVTRRGES